MPRRWCRPCRWVAAASLLGLLVFLSASIEVAQGAGWTTQSTPNGSGAEHSALYDISCEPADTEACTAVGQQTVTGVTSPYAQYWNGSTWVNQPTATPEGATGGELQADHCLTNKSCVAAGSYTTKSGTFSLVESWTGSSWSRQTTPNPEGATETKLKGVSCKVITACIAVGYSNAGGKWATAMRGNSGTWSLQTLPKPAGAISSELNGVDCTSSTSCEAVGTYNTSATIYWAWAAKWNGTEWSLQTVPKPPAEAKRSVLLDVSCSDGSSCTAVGGFSDKSFLQGTFVVRWNGTSWVQQTSPNPEGSSNSVLQNVSCFDRNGCIAVGDWLNAGTWKPMAQNWDGTTWSLDSAAVPTGSTFGLFEGVSCRVTCLAIGWYTKEEKNKTLGEVREIPTWTQRSINSSVDAWLGGVGCYSASTCLVVGSDEFTPRASAYLGAETWTEVFPPKLSEATSAGLRDVSCPSGSATCMAVGGYVKKETELPVAQRRVEAGTWTTYEGLPLPTEIKSGVLNDVSCTSASFCIAVGDFKSGVTPRSYILKWNGSSWSLQTSPNASESENVLFSVSCASSSACTAVGYAFSGGTWVPLIERWNGSSWSLQSYEGKGELYGVSCAGPSDCIGVGRAESHTLALRWNGTSWTTLTSPIPSFASVSLFAELSCTSATSCVAVGHYDDSEGKRRSLVDAWDGTRWTYQDAPSSEPITGGPYGELLAVTCLSATTCRTVGQTGDEVNQNLVLTYP
jgi:hypothetical protein